MTRSILLFSLAAARILTAADPLPSGEAVLEKYLTVTGGKAAYAKLKTQTSTAVMDFTGKGVKATITMYHAMGPKSYSAAEIPGVGKIEEGTDGATVWERSALKGPRIKTGEERAMYLRAADVQHDIRWKEYFTKVETTGLEPVDGKICYRVALTPKDGQPETRYYDKASGLLVKTSMIMTTEMGEIPVESWVSDYRKVDGLLMPFAMKQKAVGQEFTITIQSIESNAPIPADRFALPDDVKALAAMKK